MISLLQIATVWTITLITLVSSQIPGDVIIKVRSDPDFSDKFVNISFRAGVFQEFHACLCKDNPAKCRVIYRPELLPYADAIFIRETRISTQSSDKRYSCYNDASTHSLICEPYRQVFGKTIHEETFHLNNDECIAASCVGLVWRFTDEQIRFNNKQMNAEFCSTKCECPLTNQTTPVTPTKPMDTTKETTDLTKSSTQTASPSTTLVPLEGSDRSDEKKDDDYDDDDDDDDDDVENVKPIIIGVVTAIVVSTAVIVVGVIWCRRQKKHTAHTPVQPPDDTNITPSWFLWTLSSVEPQLGGIPRITRGPAGSSTPTVCSITEQQGPYSDLGNGNVDLAEHPYRSLEPSATHKSGNGEDRERSQSTARKETYSRPGSLEDSADTATNVYENIDNPYAEVSEDAANDATTVQGRNEYVNVMVINEYGEDSSVI